QNTMQTDHVLKTGEDSYWKRDDNSFNRWGDYSATCVDPANDSDFWTVQEYAVPHVGSVTNRSGQWATWWGNVTVTLPGTTILARRRPSAARKAPPMALMSALQKKLASRITRGTRVAHRFGTIGPHRPMAASPLTRLAALWTRCLRFTLEAASMRSLRSPATT